MNKLKNIFLIGPMAAGKTTIGRHLARALNLTFYDSDREIENRAGADIPWIFDVEGEEGFRKREERVISELTGLHDIVLATGGGVVLSAANRAVLSARGTVVYLQVSIEAQLRRTAKDRTRPLLKAEDPQQRLAQLAAIREPLYQELAEWTFVTDNKSAHSIVEQVLKQIEECTN